MMQRCSEKEIIAAQLRKIHFEARRAGIDNDDLHALAKTITNRDSLKGLSVSEGRRIIDRLLALSGADKTSTKGRATPEQIRLIYALASKLGWGDDPTRLRSFLEKRYQVSHPRFLDEARVNNVLVAMKAMIKGGRGERKQADAKG